MKKTKTRQAPRADLAVARGGHGMCVDPSGNRQPGLLPGPAAKACSAGSDALMHGLALAAKG
jgi:hypothetical protein